MFEIFEAASSNMHIESSSAITPGVSHNHPLLMRGKISSEVPLRFSNINLIVLLEFLRNSFSKSVFLRLRDA